MAQPGAFSRPPRAGERAWFATNPGAGYVLPDWMAPEFDAWLAREADALRAHASGAPDASSPVPPSKTSTIPLYALTAKTERFTRDDEAHMSDDVRTWSARYAADAAERPADFTRDKLVWDLSRSGCARAFPHVFGFLGFLGRGSFGVVARVRDRPLDALTRGRPLALKAIEADDEFRAEVHVSGVVSRTVLGYATPTTPTAERTMSPNFVRLHDAFVCDALPPRAGGWSDFSVAVAENLYRVRDDRGVDARTPVRVGYMLSEMATDGLLTDYVARHGADAATVRALVFQVAHATAALHSVGVQHRDLRESNVLVSTTSVRDTPQLYALDGERVYDAFTVQQYDDPLVVKIVDFGASFHVETRRDTEVTGAVTTLDARAPEFLFVAADGSDDDALARFENVSDVFAVGTVMFALANNGRALLDAIEPPERSLVYSGIKLVIDMECEAERGETRASRAITNFVCADTAEHVALYLYALFALLGFPDNTTWPGVERTPLWIALSGEIGNELAEFTGSRLRELRGVRAQLGDDGVELLAAMLAWDPARRPQAATLLGTHYFDPLATAGVRTLRKMHATCPRPHVYRIRAAPAAVGAPLVLRAALRRARGRAFATHTGAAALDAIERTAGVRLHHMYARTPHGLVQQVEAALAAMARAGGGVDAVDAVDDVTDVDAVELSLPGATPSWVKWLVNADNQRALAKVRNFGDIDARNALTALLTSETRLAPLLKYAAPFNVQLRRVLGVPDVPRFHVPGGERTDLLVRSLVARSFNLSVPTFPAGTTKPLALDVRVDPPLDESERAARVERAADGTWALVFRIETDKLLHEFAVADFAATPGRPDEQRAASARARWIQVRTDATVADLNDGAYDGPVVSAAADALEPVYTTRIHHGYYKDAVKRLPLLPLLPRASVCWFTIKTTDGWVIELKSSKCSRVPNAAGVVRMHEPSGTVRVPLRPLPQLSASERRRKGKAFAQLGKDVNAVRKALMK